MTWSDLGAVVAIENKISPFPWSENHFRNSVSAAHWCVVARSHLEVVGYAVAMITTSEAQLLNIGVVPARQGVGIGSKLMQSVIHQSQMVGATEMILEVRASNTVAQHLYRGMGFNEVYTRCGYYRNLHDSRIKEDAIIMQRQLNEPVDVAC